VVADHRLVDPAPISALGITDDLFLGNPARLTSHVLEAEAGVHRHVVLGGSLQVAARRAAVRARHPIRNRSGLGLLDRL